MAAVRTNPEPSVNNNRFIVRFYHYFCAGLFNFVIHQKNRRLFSAGFLSG